MATPALTAHDQKILDDDKAYGYTAYQFQQLYDGYAQDYKRKGSIHEDEIQTFREVAQLQQGESVLDLGCGNGVLTLAAKKLVGYSNVVGVNISDKMLGYAKKRMTEGMHFLCENVKQLHNISKLKTAHSEGIFDVIFARKAVKTPGFEPFVQLMGHAKSWVQCRVYFYRQILNAGLKLDKMVELARDGKDLGFGILECAKENWKKTGRAGKIPSDAYIEEHRRQAYADLKKAIKKRNGG